MNKKDSIPLNKVLRLKKALKYLSNLNALIYRLSGGRLWSKWSGKYPIMILMVKGKKSNVMRNIPLIKVIKDDQPILVASMGGMPMNPTWYYNVASNPRVSIQIGKEKQYYLARQVDDHEKALLWPTICSFYPDYNNYQEKTARNIPVFLCEPKQITQEWKEWIQLNIKRGCDLDEIYTILFNEGFNELDIENTMGHRLKVNTLSQEVTPSDKESEIQNMVKKFKDIHQMIPSLYRSWVLERQIRPKFIIKDSNIL